MLGKTERKDFEKKYEGVRRKISEENGVDMSIATEYLISTAKGMLGICYDVEGKGKVQFEIYKGVPADFDAIGCLADIQKIYKK